METQIYLYFLGASLVANVFMASYYSRILSKYVSALKNLLEQNSQLLEHNDLLVENLKESALERQTTTEFALKTILDQAVQREDFETAQKCKTLLDQFRKSINEL